MEEKKMTLHEVVQKMIGPIRPVGDSNIDRERFENLKQLTELVDKLVTDIDDVAYYFKDRQEHSLKQASDFASNFLKNDLGICE